jgi:tRNA pseudouridine55 synthase
VRLDKQAGITSHDAVDRLRRVVGTRRVGHAGTLDPFATGLLLLAWGRATRLLPFLSAGGQDLRGGDAPGRRHRHRRPDGQR